MFWTIHVHQWPCQIGMILVSEVAFRVPRTCTACPVESSQQLHNSGLPVAVRYGYIITVRLCQSNGDVLTSATLPLGTSLAKRLVECNLFASALKAFSR